MAVAIIRTASKICSGESNGRLAGCFGLAHGYSTMTNSLDAIFSPRSVAVIGATEREGSVGLAVMENLCRFAEVVYPVNPFQTTVLGMKSYPGVGAVPEKVDLAVVVTPAASVPEVIRQCGQAGVGGAIIISAGFKEIGAEGAALEQKVKDELRTAKMRAIGPNCLGVMVPHAGLNATFAAGAALPGSVAFISQSGALGTAVLDWSLREKVGFSAFISVGAMADVGWGDLIYYLGDDPHTKSIVIYMESVGDARSFLSAAREVALTKPIVVLKVGRTASAAKAAASHTGALTGSDEVLDAAFRRAGILRVQTIEELFDMAEQLAKQPPPKGPRLSIVTNAGGPGALATDMLVTCGGQLAQLQPETIAALNKILPPQWSHGNPVDVLGDASAQKYGDALKLTAADPNSDGTLVILTPQAMTDATATAHELAKFAKTRTKPLLACWMGGESLDAGREILNRSRLSTFEYPDTAARAFEYMWRYGDNLRSLYETPALDEEGVAGREVADKIIGAARKTGRTILTEDESKKILAAYGIPVVPTHVAKTEAAAVKCAGKLGYPVVLKLYSETITHKTDVGGVQLNLRNVSAVRKAWRRIKKGVAARDFLGVTVQPMVKLDGYELILGSSIDPQFGPVLLFGLGGQLVETFQDRALGLPPLNTTLARRMMEQTKVFHALKGVRGRKPVDLEALAQLLVRFSRLVAEQPWIKETDINPLLASPEGLLALDGRVILHNPQTKELPKLAIRPYPSQYKRPWKMKNGTRVTIRPIRPEDEPLMVKFHGNLSERTVYYRYFSQLKLEQRVAHDRLSRICFNDYDREIALVAERKNAKTGGRTIIGVGRLTRLHASNDAKFAITITDRDQKAGLGTELLKLLVEIGRDEKLATIIGHVLPENRPMRSVCLKLGFQFAGEKAVLSLSGGKA